MILLFQELHPFNAALCWVLSWVVQIRVLYVHPACVGLLGRRITQLDLSQHISSREGWAIRDAAVSQWERIEPQIPAAPWRVRVHGRQLDFSVKAKQDLSQIFADGLLLREIRRRHLGHTARLIPSASLAWCFRGRPDAAATHLPLWITWVTQLNIFCDRLWRQTVTGACLIRLLRRLVSGLAGRLKPFQNTLGPCRYLYWCDGAIDCNPDPAKRSLWWIVDHDHIQSHELFVLLPDLSRAKVRHWRLRLQTAQRTSQAMTFRECYARVPIAYLWEAMRETFVLLAQCVWRPLAGVERQMMIGYRTAAAQIRPIVRTLQPVCYIECDNSLGIEDPALVYLNAEGVTTVMYHTSAMMPVTTIAGSDARDLLHAYTLASRVICWSEAARRYLVAHPQSPTTRFEILGAIQPGSDAVWRWGAPALRKTYLNPALSARSGLKFVSAFDVSPRLQFVAHSHHDRPYPQPFPEVATIAFLRDLLRLVEELPEMVLLYKPKRFTLLEARFPTKLQDYRRLVEAVRRHDRGAVLDAESNPWIPLGMADLCISMPNCSPSWAALHYGIPAFFHDPMRIRIEEDVPLRDYYTDDYPELFQKVQQLLAVDAVRLRHEWMWTPNLSDRLGQPPGCNGNARFREWLAAVPTGSSCFPGESPRCSGGRLDVREPLVAMRG